MAHTPGPWTSDWDDNGFFTINPTRGYVMGQEGDQAADDARLMAAAPEMLEALNHITDEMELADFDPNDTDTWYGRALAIIAKAEGRA